MKNHWLCYWEPPSYIRVGEKGFSNFFGFVNTIFTCTTEMAWKEFILLPSKLALSDNFF
jgi:hypothetical protein